MRFGGGGFEQALWGEQRVLDVENEEVGERDARVSVGEMGESSDWEEV